MVCCPSRSRGPSEGGLPPTSDWVPLPPISLLPASTQGLVLRATAGGRAGFGDQPCECQEEGGHTWAQRTWGRKQAPERSSGSEPGARPARRSWHGAQGGGPESAARVRPALGLAGSQTRPHPSCGAVWTRGAPRLGVLRCCCRGSGRGGPGLASPGQRWTVLRTPELLRSFLGQT